MKSAIQGIHKNRASANATVAFSPPANLEAVVEERFAPSTQVRPSTSSS
jgi:hypothetical protein